MSQLSPDTFPFHPALTGSVIVLPLCDLGQYFAVFRPPTRVFKIAITTSAVRAQVY